MVETGVQNVADVPVEIVNELGRVGNWLEALGIIVILWVIFQILSLLLNRKRMREIHALREDVRRIETKIDSVLRYKKK